MTELHRRDISGSQRAVVALNAEKEYAEEAKERQQQSPGRPKKGTQFSEEVFEDSEKSDHSAAPTTHTTSSKSTSSAKASTSQKAKDKKKTDGEAAQQAAEAAGTNRDYVFKAKFLQQHAPDLLKQVEIGKLTITQAIKQVKAEQKAAERAAEVATMQLEVKGNYAPDIIHGDALESLRACWETGAQVKIAVCKGEGSLIEFVLEQNLHRRDLDQTQKAFLALRVMDAYAKETREKQRQNAQNLNKKLGRGETNEAISPHSSRFDSFSCETQHQTEKHDSRDDPRNTRPSKRDPQSRDKAAQVVGASARYVQSAKKVSAERLESC